MGADADAAVYYGGYYGHPRAYGYGLYNRGYYGGYYGYPYSYGYGYRHFGKRSAMPNPKLMLMPLSTMVDTTDTPTDTVHTTVDTPTDTVDTTVMAVTDTSVRFIRI